MDILSVELILYVCRYLDDPALLILRLLSRRFNRVCNSILYHKSKKILNSYREKYKIRNIIYSKLNDALSSNYYILNILRDIEEDKKVSTRSEVNILTLHANQQIQQIYKFFNQFYCD